MTPLKRLAIASTLSVAFAACQQQKPDPYFSISLGYIVKACLANGHTAFIEAYYPVELRQLDKDMEPRPLTDPALLKFYGGYDFNVEIGKVAREHALELDKAAKNATDAQSMRESVSKRLAELNNGFYDSVRARLPGFVYVTGGTHLSKKTIISKEPAAECAVQKPAPAALQ